MSRIPALAERLAGRIPTIGSELDRPRAAVALILAPNPDSLLLIRRAERQDDRWSGHLALPGGRWHPERKCVLSARDSITSITSVGARWVSHRS